MCRVYPEDCNSLEQHTYSEGYWSVARITMGE